jgi:hypothetical protein
VKTPCEICSPEIRSHPFAAMCRIRRMLAMPRGRAMLPART